MRSIPFLSKRSPVAFPTTTNTTTNKDTLTIPPSSLSPTSEANSNADTNTHLTVNQDQNDGMDSRSSTLVGDVSADGTTMTDTKTVMDPAKTTAVGGTGTPAAPQAGGQGQGSGSGPAVVVSKIRFVLIFIGLCVAVFLFALDQLVTENNLPCFFTKSTRS